MHLQSVTKKTVQVLLLAVGLVMTGHAILSPMLMVIIMLTGDFLGMSLTTDNVTPSPLPDTWRIGSLTIAWGLHGSLRIGLLHGSFGYWQILAGAWNRSAANFGLSRHRVR
jgi:H+-transporting ATPase